MPAPPLAAMCPSLFKIIAISREKHFGDLFIIVHFLHKVSQQHAGCENLRRTESTRVVGPKLS